jgi:hypothetical protein
MQNVERLPIQNFTVHTVAEIVERKGLAIKYLE